MFGAQPGVAAIMLEMVGKAGDRSGRDEIARLSMRDDARAAGGARGHDGPPARHGFKRPIAEGFGDRRGVAAVERGRASVRVRGGTVVEATGVAGLLKKKQ